MTELMLNTKDKYLYAEILFNQALNAPNVIVFLPNIEGFIALARSVTFVLQKEMKNVEGFDTWYKLKQNSMKTDPIFQFFHELRTSSIHKSPIKMTGTLVKSPTTESQNRMLFPIITTSKHVKEIKIDPDLKNEIDEKKPKDRELEIIYVLNENKNIEFIDLCYVYKVKILDLINDCARTFTSFQDVFGRK